MPLSLQAKVLRVLEEGEITRLGSQGKSIEVDVRVITATHKALHEEIEKERFRNDLYYRICTHVISVPPLRDRKDDIEPLARYFLERTCERFGIPQKKIHTDTIGRLQSYDWKMNNVRELENIVERMIIQCNGNEILPDHIPSDITVENVTQTSGNDKTFQELKQESERQILLQALRDNGWHITNTAKALGISNHSNLIKMMKRLGIQRPE